MFRAREKLVTAKSFAISFGSKREEQKKVFGTQDRNESLGCRVWAFNKSFKKREQRAHEASINLGTAQAKIPVHAHII